MSNCFQKIVKSWQTILFFAILTGSTTFVGSVFGLGGYVGEMDLLVVANNQNIVRNYSYGDLGQTLKIILKEEVFSRLLKEKFNSEIDSKDIGIRHYKKTDILQVKVKARSVIDAQNGIDTLHRAITLTAPEYYAKGDEIMIKTLKGPQVVDGYSLARQRGSFGFGVGFVIGLFIVLLTDFHLDLFSKDRSSQTIVRQKLRKELENGTVQKELKPEFDEYVFPSDDLLKNSQIKQKTTSKFVKTDKRTKKILPEKRRTKKIPEQKPVDIKPRVISLNTFVKDGLGKKAKKQLKEQLKKRLEKEIVPDNLPIFTEDKYNNEIKRDRINTQQEVSSGREKKTVAEKIVSGKKKRKDEVLGCGKNIHKQAVKRQKMFSNNVEPHEIRKPSAHNIVNGFTPPIAPSDISDNDDDLTSEEIKDRLNRLLRGDL